MTQARQVTKVLLSTAQHAQDIYLQQDLNSKDCGECIVKITKNLQEATHRFKSSTYSNTGTQQFSYQILLSLSIYIYIYLYIVTMKQVKQVNTRTGPLLFEYSSTFSLRWNANAKLLFGILGLWSNTAQWSPASSMFPSHRTWLHARCFLCLHTMNWEVSYWHYVTSDLSKYLITNHYYPTQEYLQGFKKGPGWKLFILSSGTRTVMSSDLVLSPCWSIYLSIYLINCVHC